MIRLLFNIFFFLPIIINAQNSNICAFERLEVPVNKNDFSNILIFWKQLNSIENVDLLKFDSIIFFRNDTLKYTYRISELRFSLNNTAFADSVLSASTDSTYNKELNSYDFYFTDINRNRVLDMRKYLNKEGLIYKAEHFSDGDVAVKTNWLFDKENQITKEITTFVEDSSTYQMSYKRDKGKILQTYAQIKRRNFECEYTTDYNKKGGIISYTYDQNKPKDNDDHTLRVDRNSNNLATKAEGSLNNQPFTFTFSYSENVIAIDRKSAGKRTSFKLMIFEGCSCKQNLVLMHLKNIIQQLKDIALTLNKSSVKTE